MNRTAAALVALVSLSGPALAHNGLEHLRGTVTQVTDKVITIQTADKQTKTVMLAPDTTFSKGTASATAADVKVGDRVVLEVAKKGKEMTAKEVKLGAPAAKAAAAHDHKAGK